VPNGMSGPQPPGEGDVQRPGSGQQPPDTPSGPHYGPPPEGVGRSGATEHDEEAGVQYRSPPAAGQAAEAEQAPMSASPLGEVPIPSALFEARAEMAEVLRRQVQQHPEAQALAGPTEAPNIQGVAIGLPQPAHGTWSGIEPGRPTLNVFVVEPTSPKQVESVIVESLGVRAAASNDVEVTPVVTGVIDALPHRFKLRPAPGGISIAHFNVTAGTLGCIVTGRTAPRNNRLLILSNNHVLANVNNAVYGDCICQPGPADGGACPNDQVAILERFVPITMGGAVNYVDCATAWAWPDRIRRDHLYMAGGQPAYFPTSAQLLAPQIGMVVGKTGRTTQVTSGTITSVNASISVNYGNGRTGWFEDQISIQAGSGYFSQGGDSGSLIWTWNTTRNPVGLLFAGGGGVTFANKIDRVLNALEISLIGG
jgi:hypothetical protein